MRFLIWMLISTGTAHAEPAEILFHALTRTPAASDVVRFPVFLAQLRDYLKARPADPLALEMGPIFKRATALINHPADLTRLFQIIGAEKSGLDAATVARIIMTGGFEEFAQPLRAGSAFDLFLGPRAFRMYGEISARELDVFDALVDHAADHTEWYMLAKESTTWVAHWSRASNALVSRQLDRLIQWRLGAEDWSFVLSRYVPEFPDSVECQRIAAQFAFASDFISAVSRVPDWLTRLCLQEAAAKPLRTPTEGILRTILSPVGADQPHRYRRTLEKLRDTYLPRAGRRRCDHLFAAYANDRPSAPRPKPAGPDPRFKVIEGGRLTENR